MEKKTLTVFTPAYNRGYIIHKCYESLCRQTSKDFVWLVVDDGSTDNTAELVKEWQKQDNGFEIKYIYKENGGMHTAHNTAYENIDTELNVCIDSDDYMPDDAVEIILDEWKKYRENEKYGGMVALDVDSKNFNVIGTELDETIKNFNLDYYYNHGGLGDKKLIYRTDVIKKYPQYPVFEGEKYVSLAYKYRLIGKDYFLGVINKPVCVVEYQENGSSMNMYRQYLNNPKGFAFIRKINMQYIDDKKRNFIDCIHYVSSSIVSKNKSFVKESPKKLMTVLSVPFGLLLTVIIRIKAKKLMKVK